MSKDASEESDPGPSTNKGKGLFNLSKWLDRAAEIIDEKTAAKSVESPEDNLKSTAISQAKPAPSLPVTKPKPAPLPTLSSFGVSSLAAKPLTPLATPISPAVNADPGVVTAIREKVIPEFPLIVAYLKAADSALARAIPEPSVRKAAILQTIGANAMELRTQIQQAQVELEREVAAVKTEQEQEFVSYTQPDVDEVGRQQLIVSSADSAKAQAETSLEQSLVALNAELEENIRRLRDGARIREAELRSDTARLIEQQTTNSSAAASLLAESQQRIAAARSVTDAKIGKFEASAQVVAQELTALLTVV